MYAHMQWNPISRISHHTVILCRNFMIVKGYYVKPANFAGNPGRSVPIPDCVNGSPIYYDITCHILQGFLISRQNARTGITVEPGVPSFVQKSNHTLRDFALCQEHFEYFVPEYPLQGFGI